MSIVELIEPSGDADFEVVNVDRRLRGLPPSEMEWVCQHSCAAETIPGCQDWNCEAALIVSRWDLEQLRTLVAQGELAAFDTVHVRLKLNLPRGVGVELQRFIDRAAELPVLKRQGQQFGATGSLLAFARLCAGWLDPKLSDRARQALLEIERVLTWQFSSAGPALFQQRFVDLRARPAERGNTILFLARAQWPARALVAWEEPPRQPRRNVAPPIIPEANVGFGLWLENGAGMRLGRIDRGLDALPGDLYGPTLRLVVRVDQEVADRVRGLCQARATAAPEPPLDRALLELLEAVTNELGLVVPLVPPATGAEETICARPAQFIRRLLLAQPYPPVKPRASASPSSP